MKPAPFEYFRPDTLNGALGFLTEFGDDARVLAGGQSLVPMMNLRLATPAYLIDLSNVRELSEISVHDGEIRIGAMTRQCELLANHPALENVPLLRLAATNIGHVQTRARGTVGGSLANADPAAELALVMVTLDASILISSTTGNRQVSARTFFVDAMTTVLEPSEILAAAIIPNTGRGAVCAFKEVARRHGDFALASVAVNRSSRSGEFSVGIGAIATTPRYCQHVSTLLSAQNSEREEILSALNLDLENANLLDDSTASADYRRIIATELLFECLDTMGI